MSGSTFGTLFKLMTFGESHGPALGVVIDGTPPHLPLSEQDIQTELDRRRPGQSSVTTPRQEADRVRILSGVFEGVTTGAPIALVIENTNQQSRDYAHLQSIYRPGHADYTFQQKYGIRDHRGGGRSSGRETAARVAAGAIAKQWLLRHGIHIQAYTRSVGPIEADTFQLDTIEQNPVRCPDPVKAQEMVALIERLRDEGDSIGGVIETIITGCPAGLGDPVFDKLDACLAHAMLSIGTTKGIEFGDGFHATQHRGSDHNDAWQVDEGGRIKTRSNHAGGILGGISSGEPIVFRVAIKPASSIAKPQQTVTTTGQPAQIEVHGRHDPCICPRAVPVIEAMAAMVLMDRWLIQRSMNPTWGHES
ncbi:chorismate synthase [bacterium]|nr:chorismate synthase [bacterium]